MKPHFSFVVLSFFVALGAHAGSGEGGSGTVGGGDAYAAHFAAAGNRIGKAFRRGCAANDIDAPLCELLPAFLKAIEVPILPREEVLGVDGLPRDAGPNADGAILLNFPRYAQKLEDARSLPGLVQLIAHEYFLAAGLEKSDHYEWSSQLVSALRERVLVDFALLIGTPPTLAPPKRLPLCKDRTLEDRARVGYRCRASDTTLDYWERVEALHLDEAWRAPNGVIWGDHTGYGNQYEASQHCRKIGAALPTWTDVLQAREQGHIRVLPNLVDKMFWSATQGDWNDAADEPNFYLFAGMSVRDQPSTNGMAEYATFTTYKINGSGLPREIDFRLAYRCVIRLAGDK